MYRLAMALICLLVLSCSKKDLVSGDKEQENESPHLIVLNSTLFSDSIEFFTEYPALVTGEDAVFMIHVTRLSTYKPGSGGDVLLEFGSVKAKAHETEDPGIYSVTIQPGEQGLQPMRIFLKTGSLTDQVSDSLRVYDSENEALENSREYSDPAVINYSKEQAWNSDFTVKQVFPQPFSAVIPSSGEMLPVPGEKQHVTARSNGIVFFASRNLVQGSRVTKGQLLFTLSGQNLADDNIGVRFTEARNRFNQSKKELERHSRLHKERIISDKQFYETQTRYKNDSASYYALSSSVSPAGLEIHAPLSGYLHELNIAEGQYVETGDQLATISDNQLLLLRADVAQQYVGQLNRIRSAHFRPAYSSRIYTIEELGGRLLARGASVAENNHYMPVYFEVRNDGSLIEGAFTEFYLLTEASLNAVTVPLTAVMEEQGSTYVYIQKHGAGYLKRAVTLGEHDGVNVLVQAGLTDGERVVTRGAMLLKASSMSTAMPAHAHEH